MIIATPPETYDQNSAARLLNTFPKSETNEAVTALLDEKVIVRQPAGVSVRFFGFSKE